MSAASTKIILFKFTLNYGDLFDLCHIFLPWQSDKRTVFVPAHRSHDGARSTSEMFVK